MPPKPKVEVKKGQPNLFSFFNKPKEPKAPEAAPSSSSISANSTPSHSNKENGNDKEYPNSAATSRAGDTPTPSGNSSQGSTSTLSAATQEKSYKMVVETSFDLPPASKRVQKSISVVNDEEDEWDEKAVKANKITKRERSSSDSDDLADSDEEEEELDDSDDEPVTKRKRLGQGNKNGATSKKPDTSRPPLAPVRNYNTPAQGVATPKASSQSSSSQSNKSCLFDQCSAKQVGNGNTSNSTPYNGKSLSFQNDTPSSVVSMPVLPEGVVGPGSHLHNKLDFLLPGKKKDRNNNRPDHPQYNPRTCFIPPSFLKEQTPAMLQWWIIKQDNMDTVLFFKVGKFYELFHMDADVGMSELELIYMKGDKAHSGFPEVSYGKFAGALVSKGYRVARVEQTETPEMLKERNDTQGGKKDKVVAREMCSIMSKGTRTYCHLDDLSVFESEGGEGGSLMMCIKERQTAVQRDDNDDDANRDITEMVPEYGICCVDSIIGTITLAQFQDDQQRSRLRTLLTRLTPTEVLLEANCHTAETAGTLRMIAPRAVFEILRGDEMPDAGEAVKRLHDAKYFPPADKNSGSKEESWPTLLKAVVAGMRDGSSELVVCAIGGAVWQLKRSLIDFEVISMRKFHAYVPPDEEQYSNNENDMQVEEDGINNKGKGNLFQTIQSSGGLLSEASDSASGGPDTQAPSQSRMVLDAVAMANLEVLQNNFDHSEKGSLWAFMNRCKTLFGARLLKDWVCHPLFKASDIASRTSAVADLMGSFKSEADATRFLLKGVPDLERLLARVHSSGSKRTGTGMAGHPDSRAVMYEMPIYNSRKIKDFADVLTGFESVLKVADIFQSSSVVSPVLRKIVKSSTSSATGKFPCEEMDKLLRYFRTIFDEKQAKKDGNIRPRPGVDAEYDQAKADIAETDKNLENYLKEMKVKIRVNDLKYWGTNKDRYQIEVPIGSCNKVPSEWTTKSQKKTHRRYWTPVIEDLFATMQEAEAREKVAQKDTLRRIFEKFDESRDVWTNGLRCAANLDALLSLAEVSSAAGYVWPEILSRATGSKEGGVNNQVLEEGKGPELDIQGGRHPMLEFSMSQRGEGDYIPNTLVLGGPLHLKQRGTAVEESNSSKYSPKLLLLSGPNMGGKSTLLRQTCLITILAQVGCKVPADRCVMTPVDRIFTRVGASDRILAGQSTFFVELAETATILKAATEDSLCILDELGRGTATFDGTAIAHAVVDHLVRHTRCRSLFATHYHSLVDDWEMDARVQLGHMDCIVQDNSGGGGGTAKESVEEEEVTFLYRLCSGSSPKSYGINVARLARLPAEVIALAMKQSREFEQRMKGGEEAVLAASDDAKNVGGAIMSRDLTLAYFERLVSIAHSNVSIQDLTYLASEMWRRYRSM